MGLTGFMVKHRSTLLRVAAGVLVAIAGGARAADPPVTPTGARTFSVYFENDLFAGTDQSYTNGVKLTWISPDLTGYAQSPRLPRWSLPLIRRIPFINTPGLQRNVAVSIGQAMFTPSDITRRDLIVEERPYAGWTYLGLGLHSKNLWRLDSIGLQAGVVGPFSYAEETQKLVHGLRDLQAPLGWDNQLENEPGLLAVYDRRYRAWRWEASTGFGADAIVHGLAAVGNIATYAGAGLELRWGYNLPQDFGTSLIGPGQDPNAPAGGGDTRLTPRSDVGVHLFASVDGRAVLRDVFLDGNTVAASHSVDKRPFVADVVAGVSVVWGRFKVSYAHARRTQEYDTQGEANHTFGSITVSYSY